MTAAVTHGIKGAREVRLHAPVAQVRAGLLDALDLALYAPAIAFLGEATTNHADHGVIETGVEGAALGQVFFVAVLKSAMGVEVAA